MNSEDAQSIAVEFIKTRKKPSRVNVISTRKEDGVWIVKGTCPIDMDGHPWIEEFEVHVDLKGRIEASSFELV